MSRLAKQILVVGFNEATNRSMIKYHFDCDTVSDLPTLAEGIAQNVDIAITSTAHVIENDEDYEMKSDGTWVKQKGELELSLDAAAIDYDNTASGMTADNVQNAIDEIHSTDEAQDRTLAEFTTAQSEDRAALIAQVDGGAKNIANFTFGGVVQNENVKPGTIVCTESNGVFNFSGTSDNKNYAAYILKQVKVKAGKYIISGVSGGSNRTYWIRFGSGTTDTFLFNFYDGTREVNFPSDIILTVQFVIYENQTVSNIIVSPMICTATDYTISPTFVPYRPSWQEMYEMILQLQQTTGLRTSQSTQSLRTAAPESKTEEEITEDEER